MLACAPVAAGNSSAALAGRSSAKSTGSAAADASTLKTGAAAGGVCRSGAWAWVELGLQHRAHCCDLLRICGRCCHRLQVGHRNRKHCMGMLSGRSAVSTG